jgi:monoamine oxidase
MKPLSGTRVLVAGAGLAGLSAAFSLARHGADVRVIDARDRVGGRVWTLRTGFVQRQHAEAGADIIEAEQTAVLELARTLRLTTTPILKRSFGYYGMTRDGRLAIQSLQRMFAPVEKALHRLIEDYRGSERRWDTTVARDLARQSVAGWLRRLETAPWVLERFRGLRGLFLADPEELSLLALVDFLAGDPFGGDTASPRRLIAGNDKLATGLAAKLRHFPQLRTILRRIRQTATAVVATLETEQGLVEQQADFLVVALPATTLRDVVFDQPLPEVQRHAIGQLSYGCATRVLLQFERRFWNKSGRPNAFGSDQPHGAVWDGNEQQSGRAGILSLLAGGRASREINALMADGPDALVSRLDWLGRPAPLLGARLIRWESDPWARGGYAYFDPSFDPRWRDALALPAGRVVFAGEHTHIRWQGYMNGAVESGQRASAEIAAMAAEPSLIGADWSAVRHDQQ